MGMMANENKLSGFLFNKTRRSLLALLFGHPDEAFYMNQIMRSIKSGSGAVQRELKIMTEAGIIVREKKGNLIYYRANSNSSIFNELKSIVRKTFGVAHVIRESLAGMANKIKVAFIFGSVARNEDEQRSDIDIMAIGELTFTEVVSLLSPAEKTLAREINAVVYPVSEFKKKVKEDHHFVKTVLEGNKIFIVGDEDELAGLVGRRTPKGT